MVLEVAPEDSLDDPSLHTEKGQSCQWTARMVPPNSRPLSRNSVRMGSNGLILSIPLCLLQGFDSTPHHDTHRFHLIQSLWVFVL